MRTIDLNCDLGEGGAHDVELMGLITSANVACGGHAGDAETMRSTLARAKAAGVAAGAHPGYEDRENFGRRELNLASAEIEAAVGHQLAAIKLAAEEVGVELRHVKPHGALYNRAVWDEGAAGAVAAAVRSAGPGWVLLALAGSVLARAGRRAGLRVAEEAFADRAYEADGRLRARGLAGAVLEETELAVAQAVRLAKEGTVRAWSGQEIAVRAETLCLHGDGADPVGFARAIRGALASAGVGLRAFATE